MNNPDIPTARDLMNPAVHTVSPAEPVADAVKMLVSHGFSGAPVVDADRRLVGMFSEIDCIRALAAAAFHAIPEGEVEQHMTRHVDTIGPDLDVFQIAMRFYREPVKRLPVVEDGRLVGLVARRDLLKALAKIAGARLSAGAPNTYQLIAEHLNRSE